MSTINDELNKRRSMLKKAQKQAREIKNDARAFATKTKRKAQSANDIAVQEAIDNLPVVPTLDELDTSHNAKVFEAVEMAREWRVAWVDELSQNTRSSMSMILSAVPVVDDQNNRIARYSGKGVGKSHIMSALMWTICKTMDHNGARVPVLAAGKAFKENELIDQLERFDSIRSVVGTWAQEDAHGVSQAVIRPLIGIDDIGTGEFKPWINLESRYFNLFEFCIAHGVSVIVTTNLTIPPLDANERRISGIKYIDEWIGERAWSRLVEMTPRGFMMDMSGVPDYRFIKSGR